LPDPGNLDVHRKFFSKTAILCKPSSTHRKNNFRCCDHCGGNQDLSIEKKTNIPKGVNIVDLGSYTVLPGMIDAHAHPLISADDYQNVHLRALLLQSARWIKALSRVACGGMDNPESRR